MILANFNLSETKKNELLQIAGKKLGADPNLIKEKLEAGKLDEVVGGLDPKAASRINSLLQNPAALNALLGSEQFKNILGSIAGK